MVVVRETLEREYVTYVKDLVTAELFGIFKFRISESELLFILVFLLQR